MRSIAIALLSALASTAAQAALAELNVADSSIETPDGTFVGRDFKIAKGFKLELLAVPPLSQGRWAALAWDNKNRLLAPSYNSDVLARLTIPPVGSSGPVQVEMIETTKVGAAEGILSTPSGLYFNVNRSPTMRSGLYWMTASKGDDVYDKTRVIRNVMANGDHGTHTLTLSTDGNWIIQMSGNGVALTEHNMSRVPEVWGEDNLIVRPELQHPGFNRAPESTIIRYSMPDGKNVELYGIGMRNPTTPAFNKDGEMFLYDADEELDMGYTVGYRATSFIHMVSGGDAGFRHSSKVHPTYYFDYFGPIADVGSGSPTATTSGKGAKFPARYQDAMFIGDWSFGLIHAVFLTPDGSSYKAEVTPFMSGRPFPISGITVNPTDGSLLIVTTGTQLYRVTYVGSESTEPTKPDTTFASARNVRRSLENFHGKKDAGAVATAWPYLNDPDRAIRYAARLAIEWQDPASWRDRALKETDPRRAIAAIAALARVSAPDQYHRWDGSDVGNPGLPVNRDKALAEQMVATLDRISIDELAYQDKLDLMRAYSLIFIRMGRPSEATAQRLIARFDPYLPAPQKEFNFELAEMMVYLQAPSAATKIMALLRTAPTPPFYGVKEWINPQQRQRQDRGNVAGPNIGIPQAALERQSDQIQYVQDLRALKVGWTPELRKEFMEWFVTGTEQFAGAFTTGLTIFRNDAIAQIPASERAALQSIIDKPMSPGRAPLPAAALRGRGGAAAGGARGTGPATPPAGQ